MAFSLQVVFDCNDPDRLARFYAEALHYKVQDPPAGYNSWQDFLKALGVPEHEWNSASAIVDPEGRGARIYFQQMDTPKLGKNRVHIDINSSREIQGGLEGRRNQVDKEVERLIPLGAKKDHKLENLQFEEYCVIMLDPEGNEFCIQ